MRPKLCVATASVVAGARVMGARWDPPNGPRDSGFTVWAAVDDFLDDDTVIAGMQLVCMHCLIEGHPEAGVLLDRARDEPDHIADAY